MDTRAAFSSACPKMGATDRGLATRPQPSRVRVQNSAYGAYYRTRGEIRCTRVQSTESSEERRIAPLLVVDDCGQKGDARTIGPHRLVSTSPLNPTRNAAGELVVVSSNPGNAR